MDRCSYKCYNYCPPKPLTAPGRKRPKINKILTIQTKPPSLDVPNVENKIIQDEISNDYYYNSDIELETELVSNNTNELIIKNRKLPLEDRILSLSLFMDETHKQSY